MTRQLRALSYKLNKQWQALEFTEHRQFIATGDIPAAAEFDVMLHQYYAGILQHCTPLEIWKINQKLYIYYQRRSALYRLLSTKLIQNLNGSHQQ